MNVCVTARVHGTVWLGLREYACGTFTFYGYDYATAMVTVMAIVILLVCFGMVWHVCLYVCTVCTYV